MSTTYRKLICSLSSNANSQTITPERAHAYEYAATTLLVFHFPFLSWAVLCKIISEVAHFWCLPNPNPNPNSNGLFSIAALMLDYQYIDCLIAKHNTPTMCVAGKINVLNTITELLYGPESIVLTHAPEMSTCPDPTCQICDPPWPDQLMMTPKVEFSKYVINILHVVNLKARREWA